MKDHLSSVTASMPELATTTYTTAMAQEQFRSYYPLFLEGNDYMQNDEPTSVSAILAMAEDILELEDGSIPDPTPINPFAIKVVNEFPLAEAKTEMFDPELLRDLFMKPPQPSPSATRNILSGLRDVNIISGKRKVDSGNDSLFVSPIAAEISYSDKEAKKKRAVATDSSPESFSFSSWPEIDDCISVDDASRFRDYQNEAWDTKFAELCRYKDEFGHCLVPHNWIGNRQLAQWIKRQRYQYKLKTEGKHSSMTDESQSKLEQLGFVWDSQGAAWEERYRELKAFHRVNGHCNVPSMFPENPQLSVWVKCQRRQHKLFRRGDHCSITIERMAKLDRLGFSWNPRSLL